MALLVPVRTGTCRHLRGSEPTQLQLQLLPLHGSCRRRKGAGQWQVMAKRSEFQASQQIRAAMDTVPPASARAKVAIENTSPPSPPGGHCRIKCFNNIPLGDLQSRFEASNGRAALALTPAGKKIRAKQDEPCNPARSHTQAQACFIQAARHCGGRQQPPARPEVQRRLLPWPPSTTCRCSQEQGEEAGPPSLDSSDLSTPAVG